MDAKEKLKAARLRMIVLKRFQFYGSLLLPFQIDIIDAPGTAVVDSRSTSRRMVVSKQFIESLSVDELQFVLAHELLHVIFGHGDRRVDHLIPKGFPPALSDHIRLLAADHCVNSVLLKTSFKAPDNAFFISRFRYENSTYESTVKYLIGEIDSVDTLESYSFLSGAAQVKRLAIHYKDGHVEEVIVTEGSEQVDNSLREEVKSEARSLVSRGLVDADYLDEIKQLLSIEIPWDVLLEDWIHSTVQCVNSQKTWKFLNKRLLRYALLPGSRSDLDERFGVAVFTLDLSGSMAVPDIAKLLKLIYTILHKFRKVIIIQHSVGVKDIIELSVGYTKMTEAEFLEKTKRLRGRGGTSHYAVFEKVQHYFEEFPDELSGVAILTDGYSDIESCWGQFEWCKSVPSVFVLNSETSLSLEDIKIIRIK